MSQETLTTAASVGTFIVIAATAIAHDAILVTADENLLRWRHRLKRQDAER